MPVNIFSIFIPSSGSFFKGLMEGCKFAFVCFREKMRVCAALAKVRMVLGSRDILSGPHYIRPLLEG